MCLLRHGGDAVSELMQLRLHFLLPATTPPNPPVIRIAIKGHHVESSHEKNILDGMKNEESSKNLYHDKSKVLTGGLKIWVLWCTVLKLEAQLRFLSK